jgi:hypothetical protein
VFLTRFELARGSRRTESIVLSTFGQLNRMQLRSAHEDTMYNRSVGDMRCFLTRKPFTMYHRALTKSANHDVARGRNHPCLNSASVACNGQNT